MNSPRPFYGKRYELLDLVGAGGTGTVYRARDVELDEIVALKVLRKELVRSPEVIERFRSEVKLARRVTHHNVARMFDIGEHEGERFLTMEFVAGHVLSARIDVGPGGTGRPLPLPLLLSAVQQICAALSAAHAVGVIHRDLKPDNVMLANDGRVVITDFGIARALQSRASPLPATGEFIGTPEYMSPEQAEGGAIDFRTDIYSLGVMLFEMLTGSVPFTGATPLVTAAVRLIKPPPDPRSRRPDLSEAVAQVVLRCLARQPQDRYPSAEAVAAAVTAALPAGDGGASSAFAAIRIPPSSRGLPTTPDSATTPAAHGSTLISGFGGLLDAPASGIALAVLPFRNQGAAEDAYLAEGLTDDLTDALSMVHGLRVRSRGAVQAQSNQPDPVHVGRALNVGVLIDGTIRRVDQQLRIATRLIKTEDGVQVWAQRFERPAAAVLQISDEIAQAVVAALIGGTVGPPRVVLHDTDAVDLYLRARALSRRGGPDNLHESKSLYERALALRPLDPTLLTAYAQTLSRLWFFGAEGFSEQALLAAEQAVAAAPERGESRLALATVHFHTANPVSAVQELKQALKLSPSLAEAHELLGRILVESGPEELGLRYLEHAMKLEPWLLRTQIDPPRILALRGNWEAATRILAEMRQAEPLGVGIILTQARLCLWRRDQRTAAAFLQNPELVAMQLAVPRQLLEIVAGRLRLEPRALFGDRLGSTMSSPRGRGYYHQMETELYCFYEDVDSAIRSLARAVDIGLYDRLWVDNCPLLAPLRVDLRFHAVRKIIAERAAQVRNSM